MAICERHFDMVSRNAVRIWTQKGIFFQIRRGELGEVCKCCESLLEREIAQSVGLAEKWPLRMDAEGRRGKEQYYDTPALLANSGSREVVA